MFSFRKYDFNPLNTCIIKGKSLIFMQALKYQLRLIEIYTNISVKLFQGEQICI